MPTECPYCRSEVLTDNPVFHLTRLRKWVEKNGGWGIFEYPPGATYHNAYPKGKQFTIEGWTAEVVDSKIKYDSGDISDYYDGDLPQGTTFEVFVVVKVGEGFFKKTGTGDSYGAISWDGDLLPVVPKVKTVEVYEFND